MVVTGAGGLIGPAFTKSLLDEGAQILLRGRPARRLAGTAQRWDPAGRRTAHPRRDLAGAGAALVSVVVDRFGTFAGSPERSVQADTPIAPEQLEKYHESGDSG